MKNETEYQTAKKKLKLADAFRKNFPNLANELDEAGFLEEVCDALDYLSYITFNPLMSP